MSKGVNKKVAIGATAAVLLLAVLVIGIASVDWDDYTRTPTIDDERCVGCHLCLNVCPVADCIRPDQAVFKENRQAHPLLIKQHYR